jgi:cytoskeletal protein RodZ
MRRCFQWHAPANKTGMSSVGDLLREGRERRQWTVTEVANSTNIKSDHIRAMEVGDWRAFSAPVYIKGFVRTYATHLKLPVPDVIAALEAELAANPDVVESPDLGGLRKGVIDWIMLQFSRVRWVWVLPVLVGLALLAAGYLGVKAWQRHAETTPAETLGPGLLQRPRPVQPATLPLPTNVPVPVPRPGR